MTVLSRETQFLRDENSRKTLRVKVVNYLSERGPMKVADSKTITLSDLDRFASNAYCGGSPSFNPGITLNLEFWLFDKDNDELIDLFLFCFLSLYTFITINEIIRWYSLGYNVIRKRVHDISKITFRKCHLEWQFIHENGTRRKRKITRWIIGRRFYEMRHGFNEK